MSDNATNSPYTGIPLTTDNEQIETETFRSINEYRARVLEYLNQDKPGEVDQFAVIATNKSRRCFRIGGITRPSETATDQPVRRRRFEGISRSQNQPPITQNVESSQILDDIGGENSNEMDIHNISAIPWGDSLIRRGTDRNALRTQDGQDGQDGQDEQPSITEGASNVESSQVPGSIGREASYASLNNTIENDEGTAAQGGEGGHTEPNVEEVITCPSPNSTDNTPNETTENEFRNFSIPEKLTVCKMFSERGSEYPRWLQNIVIDFEVAKTIPPNSPTVGTFDDLKKFCSLRCRVNLNVSFSETFTYVQKVLGHIMENMNMIQIEFNEPSHSKIKEIFINPTTNNKFDEILKNEQIKLHTLRVREVQDINILKPVKLSTESLVVDSCVIRELPESESKIKSMVFISLPTYDSIMVPGKLKHLRFEKGEISGSALEKINNAIEGCKRLRKFEIIKPCTLENEPDIENKLETLINLLQENLDLLHIDLPIEISWLNTKIIKTAVIHPKSITNYSMMCTNLELRNAVLDGDLEFGEHDTLTLSNCTVKKSLKISGNIKNLNLIDAKVQPLQSQTHNNDNGLVYIYLGPDIKKVSASLNWNLNSTSLVFKPVDQGD